MRRISLLAILYALHGCASSETERQLAEAQAAYQSLSNDPVILRDAPRDVVRSGESLERAIRFATYVGGTEDSSHYAYLSQRYGDIARQTSERMENQRLAARLSIEHARLRRLLQDVKDQAGQPQEDWNHVQLINLSADETDRGLVMTLGDVLFKPASADLSASANRTLIQLSRFLQLNPKRVVRIEGYTDGRGDASVNLELSRARAQAVANFLHDLGIESSRMEIIGYGEQHNVSENASARGRAQNRRVEILLSDEEGRLSDPRVKK